MNGKHYVKGYIGTMEKVAAIFGAAPSPTPQSNPSVYMQVSPGVLQILAEKQQKSMWADRKADATNRHWWTRAGRKVRAWYYGNRLGNAIERASETIANGTPIDERRRRAIQATDPNARFLELNADMANGNRKDLVKSINFALDDGGQAWALTEGVRRRQAGFAGQNFNRVPDNHSRTAPGAYRQPQRQTTTPAARRTASPLIGPTPVSAGRPWQAAYNNRNLYNWSVPAKG